MRLEPDKKKGNSNLYKEIGPYIGLGLQLAVTVTVSVFVGIWLDNQFGTKPVFIVALAFFGVFAGMYTFIKSVLKAGNDKK